MLARVAENIYWLARYVERAEDLARLIGVNTNLKLDLPRGIAPTWDSLVSITGAHEAFQARAGGEITEQRVVRFLLADTQYPGSLLSCLNQARENARTVRELLPREAYEQINALVYYARDNVSAGVSKRGRHTYLVDVIKGAQTLVGLLDGTMNQDEAFQFFSLGRHLERADMTTRIVDVRSVSLISDDLEELRPFDAIQWLSVLKSLSASQMYRLEIRGAVRREGVLRFLLQSRVFPRSVLFCADRSDAALGVIGEADDVRRHVARLQRLVQEADVSTLSRARLAQFIDEAQIALAQVHDATAATFFMPQFEGSQMQAQA